MSSSQPDLVVLVADQDIETTMAGLLARHQSLTIRPISRQLLRHPQRDAGCLHGAHTLLRSQATRFRHALVVFDHDGCGQEHRPRDELESEVEERLGCNGWGDRCAAIIVAPEIEQWVWSDSPEVEQVLGWAGRNPALRTWLETRKLWTVDEPKPHEPKLAMEHALREARIARSPANFGKLAERVSFKRCTDPAFLKLREVLRRWFAPAQ